MLHSQSSETKIFPIFVLQHFGFIGLLFLVKLVLRLENLVIDAAKYIKHHEDLYHVST